ncbi:ATP-binding cassette domain-containing protein [Bailinhaonella thermotolerans]|uniref:ATP-binding cassette domain-containing protein n=2 Tax=Bailinhaonella thermotolerans TaxID=1070861 RepID=A0A3A4ASP1_9ACTN|nr:ATP-binding cassette domain-containing protein [Bailinhaonella thermotolerans]
MPGAETPAAAVPAAERSAEAVPGAEGRAAAVPGPAGPAASGPGETDSGQDVSRMTDEPKSHPDAVGRAEAVRDEGRRTAANGGAGAGRGPGPLRRGIEVRDLWFRYSPEHPWVLRGVDFEIPAGGSVGLVGRNGSGKSTLVKLLCRFYDPVRGAILWDGRDLREFEPGAIRERMSAVFQDFMSYDLSAAENIGVGDLTAIDDRARIEEAARAAGVHDKLAALPRGYDTALTRIFFDVSDDDPSTGVILSGGQWQRLALARALVRGGRDLLILDEPSSGLDAQAEHEIHTSLKLHGRDRTRLLISHRLSAVRDADLLVVLDEGRITEQGDHASLMRAGGVYADLFTLQAAGYQSAGEVS